MDQKLGDDGQNGVHVEYVGQRTDLGEGGERLWRCVLIFFCFCKFSGLTFDRDMNRKQPARRIPCMVACLQHKRAITHTHNTHTNSHYSTVSQEREIERGRERER